MKNGIDISHHQGSVDFEKVKNSGIDFVILREGYRRTVDSRFFEYAQKALRAGLKILGVYHFSYALNQNDAKNEAISCVSNVQKAALSSDTMIFYDFEYDTVDNAKRLGVTLGPAECNEFTTIFCNEIKRLGYSAGVYTNYDYYKNWYRPGVLSSWPIWYARYNGKEPDVKCLIYQYSATGDVPGISGNVDLDRYYGKAVVEDKGKKTKDEIANEVIDGKWGVGHDRKQSLTNAGYNYEEIQKRVNEILNGDAITPTSSIQNQDQTVYAEVVASSVSKNLDKSLSGSYVTTADLYCRNGAGTNQKAICIIPANVEVKCYGYYSVYNGIKWLCIQFVMDHIKYTGFSSSVYLRKISK